MYKKIEKESVEISLKSIIESDLTKNTRVKRKLLQPTLLKLMKTYVIHKIIVVDYTKTDAKKVYGNQLCHNLPKDRR